MNKKIVVMITFILSFLQCNNSSEKTGTVIDIAQMRTKPIEEIFKFQYFTTPIFVALKSKDIHTYFGKMSKVELHDDKIYILDQGIKSLVVYFKTGEGVTKIGKRGQGPNEYLDIADFAIDNQGYIYCIDGRWDKLFVYDNNYELVSVEKLPFEADKIQILEDGKYMFALSSWNRGEGEKAKIAITDKKFNILKTYFQYDEYVDENYWISDYQFVKTKEYIVYNKPIDNTIYLFSLKGELIKTLTLDFGKENVPNKEKADIEKYIKNFDGYTLMKNYSVVSGGIIWGTLWEHRESKLFLLDTSENILFKSSGLVDSDNTFYTGFSDSTLISFIDPDFYQEHLDYPLLTPEFIEHLKKGEFVLSIRYFNR